jgi:hypothetical protein
MWGTIQGTNIQPNSNTEFSSVVVQGPGFDPQHQKTNKQKKPRKWN